MQALPLFPLLGLLACNSSTIPLDPKDLPTDSADSSSTDSADTASDTDSSATDSSGTITDSSGTITDSGTVITEPPADCEPYGWVADQSASLQQGSTFDAYDSQKGAWSAQNQGATALVVNSTADCALTLGATVQGDLWVGGDPAKGICSQFGASVTGNSAQLAMAVAMPVITEPAMGASVGAVSLGWNESQVWDVDTHLDSFYAGYGSTITVTRSLAILVDGDFAIEQVPIAIPAGAQVDLYVRGNVRFGYDAAANTDGEPSRFRIHLIGAGTVSLDWGSALNAVVQTPDGGFSNNGGVFSGTWMGKTASTSYGATQHLDLARACP
jgi:hypothetical protein